MKKGMVSLVGAGCGDPEFLTIKAFNRLQSCEALVYDSLVAERMIEQVPADCEKIYVGKRYGRHAMKQEEINALLIRKAQEGKRVVRLKGGDPYVFGRGGEEFLALLEAGIFCEEIPGITSCVAVPAAAGIPVTHRGKSRSFTVITGTAAQEDGQEALSMDFGTLARLEGTLVILMGTHYLEEIAGGLTAAGKPAETPCAVIMEGTTAGQKTVRAPLNKIAERAAEENIKPPAVIVIGAVAQMELLSDKLREKETGAALRREKRDAFREAVQRPLSGITVGVTGTSHFSKKLSEALREKGAGVCDMSFMEILENPDPLPELKRYGWLVFTSPNGARIFLEKLKRERLDLRGIGDNKIAVIGPGTAAVFKEAGIYADFMPRSYNAAHLGEGLTGKILAEGAEEGRKPTLFLRASKGSEALPQEFLKKRLPFTEFALYETGADERKRKQMMKQAPDYVVFGAGSGVRAWFEGEKELSGETKRRYVCMGEACGRELARYSKEDFLVAKESSVEGIVDCLITDCRPV